MKNKPYKYRGDDDYRHSKLGFLPDFHLGWKGWSIIGLLIGTAYLLDYFNFF